MPRTILPAEDRDQRHTLRVGGTTVRRYEQMEKDAMDVPSESVIYVRQEAPALLWRSIVQGFGLAVGLTMGTIFIWAGAFLLLGAVLHQTPPSLPHF
jgi:hypothetical protein